MTASGQPDHPSTFDVIVVGLGPGGESTANKLARAGLSVLAVDKHLVGGECPFYGCIPSKIMIRATNALAEARRVGTLAGAASVTPSWSGVAARIREVATHDWDDAVSVQRLQDNGATVVHGHASLVGEREVSVDGVVHTARRAVVLGTGTDPGVPPIDGLADTPYWTNREVVQVTDLPSSLAVLGAGPIGCELAQVFTRYGVRVTLLEAADRIMLVEEPETSELIAKVFTDDGMRVMPGVDIASVRHEDGQFHIRLADEEVVVEKLLVSAGRDANLPDLGLDSVAVDGEAASLDTDCWMHVRDDEGEALPWLYAVGDVVGQGGQFTHTAKYQAGIVIREILEVRGPRADYRAVPRVTFTDPEVGSVGLTESQAREEGREVTTALVDLSGLTRGKIHGVGNEGLVKLVAEGDLLVGATTISPMGGEMISMLTTAVHAEVPISTLKAMIYPYPTWHGDIRTALSQLG